MMARAGGGKRAENSRGTYGLSNDGQEKTRRGPVSIMATGGKDDRERSYSREDLLS